MCWLLSWWRVGTLVNHKRWWRSSARERPLRVCVVYFKIYIFFPTSTSLRFWFLPFGILPKHTSPSWNFLNKNTISGSLDVKTMTKWFYSQFWKRLNLTTVVFYDNLCFHVPSLLLYHHFFPPQIWTISYLRIGRKQIPFSGIHLNGKAALPVTRWVLTTWLCNIQFLTTSNRELLFAFSVFCFCSCS